MKRQAVILAFILLAANASAHLNHVQFATIDEVGGQLHVRYRMSADMFMSNLDVEIKSGRLSESIKQRPLDEIIRQYFQRHLALESGGATRTANSVAFSRDEKTGDWVADFTFDAPASGSVLLCDAFLENNPRTQTLASIDWRGEKTMFHFRKGNERYLPGSTLHPAAIESSPRGAGDSFFDGLAQALKAYVLLLAGALVCFVLTRVLQKWKYTVPLFALVAATFLSFDECGCENLPRASGFALGWLAIAITGFALGSGALPAAERLKPVVRR